MVYFHPAPPKLQRGQFLVERPGVEIVGETARPHGDAQAAANQRRVVHPQQRGMRVEQFLSLGIVRVEVVEYLLDALGII